MALLNAGLPRYLLLLAQENLEFRLPVSPERGSPSDARKAERARGAAPFFLPNPSTRQAKEGRKEGRKELLTKCIVYERAPGFSFRVQITPEGCCKPPLP